MSDDRLKPGGALQGRLFRRFLEHLGDSREPGIGERVGAWRIVAEIGRGGSGVVYRAERADGAYEQAVALKWLRGDRPVPGGAAALGRERDMLAGLDHPHIARLIDGGETDDGRLWFAMDLVDGRTIDRAARDMTLNQRIALVRTLCRAVHHAHGRGLIHGDIKPSNVLVDDERRPRLVDFGISRLRRGGPGGGHGLTPDYASPEQRRGERLTTASDIWQLGRLLAGLVDGASAPGDLRSIIKQATADAPEERYASAAAMAADLDARLARRPVAAHGGSVGYRFRRFVERNRAASLVGALALTVIAGGGAWMSWQLAIERDTARAEAARAEAALADTRQALERAEALRDFLVGLFEATRPDRPHDELPSTAKILARGAERALDGDDVPAVERFGMLTTLARVYIAQSQYDKARPLADHALELAGSREAISALERARAMELKADLMTRAGDSLESVESLLVEAERLLPEAEERWSTLARIRLTRAWLDRHRQDDRRALARIEPVYETMPDAGVDRSLEATLYDSLATLYGATGKTDEALAFRRRATAAFRDAQGPEGQGHIVSLANGAGLAFTLGHFELAEDQARRAIAGYDKIYRDPVDYRAAVRNTLARILIARGAVTAAFETLERAGREYAAFMGKADDEWPLYHSLRGTFRLRLGRAQSAVADFERARSLLREQGGYGARLEATLDMLLAWGLCRAGSGRRGRALLASIDDPDTLRGPRIRAQVFEARAACRLAAGEAEAALSAADKALATHAPPGRVLDAVDRQLLRARSLRSLGRSAAAERALDEAERRFLALGLEQHPRLAELRRQRRIGELP